MSQKNDLISRQAAIDALFELYEYQRDIDPTEAADLVRQGIFLAEKKIEQLPSAQPEIIYCKKCKHWTRTCGDEQWGLGDCDVFDKHLVMCNGYCAWAERQEE